MQGHRAEKDQTRKKGKDWRLNKNWQRKPKYFEMKKKNPWWREQRLVDGKSLIPKGSLNSAKEFSNTKYEQSFETI